MKKTHLDSGNNRFFNPWAEKRRPDYLGLIKWLVFSRNRFREEKKKPFKSNVLSPDFESLDKGGRDYMVWLGHSTVIIRISGKTFITDPVFWDVNFLVKRKTPLPLKPEEIPKIDYVLISHGHYDHLNTKSVRFLKEKFDPVFIAGPGYGHYLRPLKISKHIVLDWWEAYDADGARVTSLPVQHWSKRRFFDTNRMLWCSFMIEKGGFKIYWIGDTGYYNGFKEIGRRFAPVDILVAPVGAYEPRWFMKRNHVNPEEALQIGRDIGAKTFIPIHWGTFDLTDEPLWLPLEHLKEIYVEKRDPALKILEHGGHIILDNEPPR